MWALLDWLYQNAVKVYDWFGDRYWDMVWIVSNLFDYITITLAGWWGFMQSWILNRIDDAVQFAVDVRNELYSWIDTRVNEVLTWLWELWGNINNNIDALYTWFMYRNEVMENNLRNWVNDFFGGNIEYLKGWVLDRINDITNILEPIIILRNYVNDIISFFVGDVYRKLIFFVSNLYDTIIIFVDDPDAFILAILRDNLWNFLEDKLADWIE